MTTTKHNHDVQAADCQMKCIWCSTPAGGFFLDDLCPECEKRFAELSAKDSTYAENDPAEVSA